MEIKNPEEILVYAFRYALGRMTYSTSTVSNEIISNWDDISASHQKLYQREIEEAIKMGGAGMDCDVRNWERILDLKVKTKEDA